MLRGHREYRRLGCTIGGLNCNRVLWPLIHDRTRIRCITGFLLLALVALPLCAGTRTLTILHTNDLHARLSPLENRRGGFPRLAAVIRRERAGCSSCILLNAGDLVQGSPVSTIFRGLPVFEIANLFGYDVATLGNHDFDYGWRQARRFVRTANYPVISSNIADRAGALFAGPPYLIREVNGIRVAVVGAMTDSLHSLTTPDLLETWHTLPVVETVRRYAREVKPKADIVVVLAHVTGEEEAELLKGVPEVSVIVSGHLHHGMDAALSADNRVLVRVKGYGEELGRLELQVDLDKKSVASWRWKRIPITPDVAPAADVASLVSHWEAEVSRVVDVHLSESSRAFTKSETKLMIEQAMRDETGADLAFMNGGGVRDVIPKGVVLARHIWNIMPFGNRVVIGSIKGSQVPPSVTTNLKIDPAREYTLAVTDFTAANQSAPRELGTTGLVFPKKGPVLRDLLIFWVKRQKVLEPRDALPKAAILHFWPLPLEGLPPVFTGIE